MNDIVNADTAPPSPPDLLTAAALPKTDPFAPVPPVALDDIVAAMRASLESGRLPEFDTMIASQAFVMNMAFNRLMASGLHSMGTHSHYVDVALKAQRRVCDSLNTLQRLRASQSGKGTEGP